MTCLRGVRSVARPVWVWSTDVSAHGLTCITFQRRPYGRMNGNDIKSTVYVYKGKGTTTQCYSDLSLSLRSCLHHNVEPISPQCIIQGDWRQHCAAIVFGGGYASGFVEALGSTGVQRIQDFVREGGTYLGVCAGAYLACDWVVFDQKGCTQVSKKRPLQFYPGVGIGPINHDYNPAQTPIDPAYPVTFHIGAQESHWHDDIPLPDVITVNAYVNGGGTFLPRADATSTAVDILAWFDTAAAQKAAAVVKCHVGQGRAILVSPHMELSTARADDALRAACWRWVLRQGRLRTRFQLVSYPQVSDSPEPECQVEFG